ncbi:MAG: PocR ligand-binding domain-containing protein [Spirochaetota bacterium]
MVRYFIESQQMNDLLSLLHRLFDIRITFFDMADGEVGYFDIKGMSKYCSFIRRDTAMNARCIACDKRNLLIAQRTKDIHIYHCHRGLAEGIIPLSDTRGVYLGAIVFGQVRIRGSRSPSFGDAYERRYYRMLPSLSRERLADIARMLKYVSEHIIVRELVRHKARQWMETLLSYIDANGSRRIGIADMAKAVDRSPSFISHYFVKEFGVTARAYIMDRKLRRAAEQILAGKRSAETARQFGFYDEFHFSKAFKKKFGVSPRAYAAEKRSPLKDTVKVGDT